MLAAAVRGGANTVVTFKLKDFPDEGAATHGIEILHPDSFLIGLLGGHAETVVSALERETAAFQHPPQTVTEFLASLTPTVPMFANLAADALFDPPGPVSPVPALVMSDDEAGIAPLGEPGDMTNPAQVAFGCGGQDSWTTSTWPETSRTTHARGATINGRSTTSLTGRWPRS